MYMKKFFIHALLMLAIILPLAASAAQVSPSEGGASRPCDPNSGKLCNPLNYDSIQQLWPKLLDIVAQIGLVICTLFIIYAGFKYVTAAGNTSDIEKAHNILKWAVVGTAVLLGAKVLASILSNTVNQLIK